MDYTNVQVSSDMPAACVAMTSNGSRRHEMNRLNLLFVLMLFLPALVVRNHWKRRVVRVRQEEPDTGSSKMR